MQKGFTAIYLIVGLLTLTLVAGGVYLLGITKNQSSDQTQQNDLTSPTTSPIQKMITAPEKNTLYLANYYGKEVFFTMSCTTTNQSTLDYLKLPNWKDRIVTPFNDSDYVYIGSQRRVNDDNLYGDEYPYDFRKLSNPKEILKLSECFSVTGSLNKTGLYNKDKTALYVSLNFDNNVNKIYQINLNKKQNQELWVNKMLRTTNEYDNYYGPAYVDQVSNLDKYLVFSLLNCTQCSPPAEERVSLILNILTKKYSYKGFIGNIKIDESNNVFSYQKLAPVKESCADCQGMCPGCGADGMKTVFKPSGQVFTEKLP